MTVQEPTLTISRGQLDLAHRLAMAYSHGWGECKILPRYPKSSDLTQGIEISIWEGEHAAFVELDDMEVLPYETVRGILHVFSADEYANCTYPILQDDYVVHTTGTGRLTWRISPTEVELIISRPSGNVIRVTGMLTDDIWPKEVLESIKVEVFGPYYDRHLQALQRPMAIVWGPFWTLKALAPLVADSLPD